MSIYRNVVWFAKGYQEYTKGGYLKKAKNFKSLNRDLSGKTILITGGNSGIGLDAACLLGSLGANIHIACRSKERGEAAVEKIKENSKGEVCLHLLDLSDSEKVHVFAKNFDQELYCLVNNAGCMVNDRQMTSAGFEKNFATNTLGMYILTKTFLNDSKISKNGRVVTVTSGGMLTQKLDLSDLQMEKGTFDGTMSYASQKRQQVCITEEWAKSYPDIHFSTTHPGWADTPAVRTSMPDFYEKMKDKLRTSEQGADCITWLVACDDDVIGPSGGFYQDRESVAKHLPLAWSKESQTDRTKLLEILDKYFEQTKTN